MNYVWPYCKVQSKNVCTPLMGCWASYWGKTNMAHCITWVGSLTKLPANRALESDDKESCPPPKKYRQIPLIWDYFSANHITKGGLSSLTKWTCKRGTHGPDPAHTMSHAPLPHPLFSDYVSEHIIESRQARMIRPLRCDTSYIHKSICFQSNPIINKAAEDVHIESTHLMTMKTRHRSRSHTLDLHQVWCMLHVYLLASLSSLGYGRQPAVSIDGEEKEHYQPYW